MGIFDVFSRRDWNILAITYEGPGRLRLNANHKRGSKALKAMKGASLHPQTVCWIVFDRKEKKIDDGLGPAAVKLGEDQASKILLSLPTNRDVLTMLLALKEGRDKRSSVFKWKT